MELQIKPHHINKYPLGGFIIKSPSIQTWLEEIHKLKFPLEKINLYPLPGTTPNSVWGCFISTSEILNGHNVGKHEMCQRVNTNFFIPEKSVVTPVISQKDNEILFSKSIYLFHPEIGMVELENKLSISDFIQVPEKNNLEVIQAEKSVFIPQTINSFLVKPLAPEEVLKHLEEDVFPNSEKMPDEPLTPLEKGKLKLYRLLFKNTDKDKNDDKTEESSFFSRLKSLVNLFKKDSNWSENLKKDYEDLEKRNQSQMDKFMDMLKNNPEEALKYAIPLDHQGTNRGIESNRLDFTKRWGDFSLLNRSNSQGSGGTINLGDQFNKLDAQYRETAKDLIDKGEYQKAAFIYMKLLKNYYLAAVTLENGKYYQEAATIYLKHMGNKKKAAQCYENGNMIIEAIELYIELNDYEKVADLYVSINKIDEAKLYYERIASSLKSKKNYLRASFIYKNKLDNEHMAQVTLLDGWKENEDAYNCLRQYFDNIHELKHLKSEINNIYAQQVNEENRTIFLRILYHEFKKKNELSEELKEMAYQIISAEAATNPNVVEELKKFNKSDKEILKDTSRFKYRRRV